MFSATWPEEAWLEHSRRLSKHAPCVCIVVSTKEYKEWIRQSAECKVQNLACWPEMLRVPRITEMASPKLHEQKQAPAGRVWGLE